MAPTSCKERELQKRYKMAILFAWPEGDMVFWRREMENILGPLDFRVFPETGKLSDIEYALVWRHPDGDLARYPNLKAIFSLGAGVPFVLKDPSLPDVPLVRFANDELSRDMAQYAIYWVLHFHRDFFRYQNQQRNKDWTRHIYPANHERRIGVLGLGEIGSITSATLARMGFPVTGWSSTRRTIDGVTCLAGFAELNQVLEQSDILVSVLPATDALQNLLSAERLRRMPQGAFLINMGRGENIVDADLVACLRDGHLAGAAFDVFQTEPLPFDDPYWSLPNVHVTPHVAGPSTNVWAPRLVAENIQRMQHGNNPYPIVDRLRGY